MRKMTGFTAAAAVLVTTVGLSATPAEARGRHGGWHNRHDDGIGAGEIIGYLRWPETPGWFVTEHDTKGNIWFVRDPVAMAKAQGWGPVAPFYIDQEAPVPPNGFPRPEPLTVKLKNDHLGYAITWFGLAASLLAVFVVWAARERYNKT